MAGRNVEEYSLPYLWAWSTHEAEHQCSAADKSGLLTQLIAIVAGVNRENEMMAKRREPAGTGAGGTISATLPYG